MRWRSLLFQWQISTDKYWYKVNYITCFSYWESRSMLLATASVRDVCISGKINQSHLQTRIRIISSGMHSHLISYSFLFLYATDVPLMQLYKEESRIPQRRWTSLMPSNCFWTQMYWSQLGINKPSWDLICVAVERAFSSLFEVCSLDHICSILSESYWYL